MNDDDILKKLGAEKFSLQEQLKSMQPNILDQFKELASKNHEHVIVPNLNVRPITENPAFRHAIEEKQRKEAEREKREIELTENSNKSVELQEELVKLQKETIEILKTKIDSANHTLDLLLNSLGANSQKTQCELIENRKLLAELQILIENKDGNSVKKFIADHGIESIALIVQLISMMLSPGGK
jgi:hypothetical protein